MVKARTLWPGVESPPAPTGQGAEHPVYPCQSNCISSPDCHLLNDPSNKALEKSEGDCWIYSLVPGQDRGYGLGLVGLFGALAILGFAGGYLLYLGEMLIFRAVSRYWKIGLGGVFDFVSGLDPDDWEESEGESRVKILQRFYVSGMKTVMLASRIQLRMFLPVGVALFSIGVMVAMDVWLFLLVVLVVPLYAFHAYRIGCGVRRTQDAYKKQSGGLRDQFNATLKKCLISADSREEKRRNLQQALEMPVANDAVDLFWDRRLALGRMQLLNTFFFLTSLILLFSYFRIIKAEGTQPWTHFIAFVFALQLAFKGMRQVTVGALRLVRYFPSVRDYVDLRRREIDW